MWGNVGELKVFGWCGGKIDGIYNEIIDFGWFRGKIVGIYNEIVDFK